MVQGSEFRVPSWGTSAFSYDRSCDLIRPEPRTPNPLHITLDIAEQSIQRKAIVYDGTGDEHYDAASALTTANPAGSSP